jgi:hypothetical protein
MLLTPTAIGANETGTAHRVQLFDSDRSIADGVAEFVREGLLEDEQILVVMKEERWNAVAMRLSALGCSVDDALRAGRLVVRNVEDMLKRFMVRDTPNGRLFATTVGALVERQAALGRPLRIYGEMVDELAAQGQYKAALELEELWNDLATAHRFTLFCGYTAGHFGDPHNASDLRRICAAHTAVDVDPQDVLAAFLVRRVDAASAP